MDIERIHRSENGDIDPREKTSMSERKHHP